MQLDIKVDLSALNKIVAAYENGTPRAVEAGLDAAAKLVMDAKKREMQQTYRRPPRKLKNGKPAWTRKGTSGGWLGEQEIEKGEGTRTIKDTGEPAKPITNYEGGYAERLASLPDGPDGINRSNPAGKNAAEKVEPQIQPVFEDAFRREIGL